MFPETGLPSMSVNELRYFPQVPSVQNAGQTANHDGQGASDTDLEPATCTEAEPFALRVLDDSMQPEFRRGCIILIDPTGRATDGSYVLADDGTQTDVPTEGLVFRQLQRDGGRGWLLRPLNSNYPVIPTAGNFSKIVGVIVQRAGVRRSYHKHYA